jgi:chemotaxis protein CheX
MKTTAEVLTDQNSHASWIPVLEVAAKEVFELMLNSKLTMQSDPVDGELDITSMVGLAGKLCGVLSIKCGHETAKLMAAKMLGLAPDKIGEELCDAFGEVANMIAGNFKNKISGLGDGCMLSVPTVITGKDYSLHSRADSAAIEVNMLFEGMPMLIALKVNS